MKITPAILEAMGFNRQYDGAYGMRIGVRWLRMTEFNEWKVEIGYPYSMIVWVTTVDKLLEVLFAEGERTGRETTQRIIRKAIGVWDA